ncbi:hypothetical protein [Phytobacter diazotrophicus]|uniref:hypothetical protein n=1 Tax=Phytobacter diazotrophicus TaxID=395631 RepID=UPI002FF79966
MISNKTKIELIASKRTIKGSLKNINIHFNTREISNEFWMEISSLFAIKSKTYLIKQAICFLAGSLTISEKGYFDQLDFDKISVVLNDVMQKNIEYKNINNEEIVSFFIPQWQVAMIASSLPKCKSVDKFIKLSLEKSHSLLLSSFQEGEF